MNFKASKCPECGADLNIPDGKTVVRCNFCDRDIHVNSSNPQHLAQPTDNWMKLARAAHAAGNQDEAYSYYTKILEYDVANWEAWLGKAISAGLSATLANDRFEELLSGVERAIECAPPDSSEMVTSLAAQAIVDTVAAYFSLSSSHTIEFISLSDSWIDHVYRCRIMLDALKTAHGLQPGSKEPLELTVQLSKALLERIKYHDEFDTDSYGNPIVKVHALNERQEAEVRGIFDAAISTLRTLDASYQTPEIRRASIWTDPMMVVGLIALIVVAVVVLVIFL